MGLKYYLRGLGMGIIVTALIMGIVTRADSKEILSDDEIRERAKELGMVEASTVLADTVAQESASSLAEGEVRETMVLPSPGDEEEVLPQKEEGAFTSPEEERASEASEKEEDTEDREGEKPTVSPETTANPTKEPEPSSTPTPTSMPTLAPTALLEQAASPTQPPETTSTQESATLVQQGESVTIQIANGDSSFAVCKKLMEAGVIESANEFDSYLCRNGYDKSIRAGSFEIPIGTEEEEIAKIILKLSR